MRPLAFLIALLFLAPAAYAKPPRVNGVAWIGGLALHFDANRWDVNGALNEYDVFCKTLECEHTTISISVANEPDACAPAALAFGDKQPASAGRVDKFSHAGLDFLIAEGSFGCNNLAGGPVRACTAYSNKTYLINAPGQGCKTNAHASQYVNEILRGLRPR